MTNSSHLAEKKASLHYPFWFGGSSSCLAALVTHPLDLVKVRLQTQNAVGKKNMVQMFSHIAKTDGISGLYKGLTASLLRQLTYSTVRFGVYEDLKQRISQKNKNLALPQLIAISSAAGFIGGVAGNPADVLNVRMQNDASRSPGQQYKYRHAIDGLFRMIKEEGPYSLWRGVWPNSMRASLMTASQLASYDTIKSVILRQTSLPDNSVTHFTASLLAGFVATTVCSPVDVIKTRIMSASESTGILQFLSDTYRNEGATWMFRGWVPSFIRLGPHTIATFMFLEQHRRLYRYLKGID